MTSLFVWLGVAVATFGVFAILFDKGEAIAAHVVGGVALAAAITFVSRELAKPRQGRPVERWAELLLLERSPEASRPIKSLAKFLLAFSFSIALHLEALLFGKTLLVSMAHIPGALFICTATLLGSRRSWVPSRQVLLASASLTLGYMLGPHRALVADPSSAPGLWKPVAAIAPMLTLPITLLMGHLLTPLLGRPETLHSSKAMSPAESHSRTKNSQQRAPRDFKSE